MADNQAVSTDDNTTVPTGTGASLASQDPTTMPTVEPGAPVDPFLGYEDTAPFDGVGGMPTYKASYVDELMRSLSDSEWIDLKRQMVQAGFYDDPEAVDVDTANRSVEDFKAVRQLLTQANLDRTGYQVALQHALIPDAVDEEEADAEASKIVDAGLSIEGRLRGFALMNGLDVGDKQVMFWGERIQSGETSVEQVLADWREKYVAGAYPAWKDEILAGQDVADIAAPYTQKLESMLDLPAGSVSLSDPLVKKALQGVDANGKPGIVPLHQFEWQVRQTDRYADSPQGMNALADGLRAARTTMNGMF